MTDKEVIIKALGVCISDLDCTKCPYTNVLKCSIERDCIDLINHQQAEIERLQEYYKRYFDRNRTINELQENIEHLQGKIDMYEEERKYHFEMSKKAQAKAIKEFAERLKEKPIKYGLPLFGLQTKSEIEEHFDDIMMQVRDAIDTLVKEMAEE